MIRLTTRNLLNSRSLAVRTQGPLLIRHKSKIVETAKEGLHQINLKIGKVAAGTIDATEHVAEQVAPHETAADLKDKASKVVEEKVGDASQKLNDLSEKIPSQEELKSKANDLKEGASESAEKFTEDVKETKENIKKGVDDPVKHYDTGKLKKRGAEIESEQQRPEDLM
ncbi:hypothetical protein LJB42_004245 [Komagataella kurtzmanii]|nr:hypothetical protein LJB42_004245 [Komagataella kurtzmanii]